MTHDSTHESDGPRSKASPRSWLACGLVAIAASLIGMAAATLRRSASPPAALFVAPEFLDFGEVWVGEAFQLEIPIRNVSKEIIRIQGFDTSCACTSVSPQSLSLPPGHEQSILVTVDLTRLDRAAAASGGEKFEGWIAPRSNSWPNGFIRWNISGRVRYALLLGPPRLTLSTVQGTDFVAASVRVQALVPVDMIDAECPPEQAAVKVEQDQERHGKFLLTVEPRSDLQEGRHEFTVLLRPRAPNAATTTAVPVPVILDVQSDIATIPQTLALGLLDVGEEASESVVIHSRSGRSLRLVDARAEPLDSVKVESIPAHSEDDIALVVTQHAQEAGPHSGTVRILVGYAEEHEADAVECSFQVVYHGRAP